MAEVRRRRELRRFYVIGLVPKGEFDPATFRTHDVGRPHFHMRVAGRLRRTSIYGEEGDWVTHKWMLPRELYTVRRRRLIPLTEDARKMLETLERRHGEIYHIERYVFGFRGRPLRRRPPRIRV